MGDEMSEEKKKRGVRLPGCDAGLTVADRATILDPWLQPWVTTVAENAQHEQCIVRQILTKLERIPCMSDDCDGIEDDDPAFKHRVVSVRCHKCEAVRLAKGVLSS